MTKEVSNQQIIAEAFSRAEEYVDESGNRADIAVASAHTPPRYYINIFGSGYVPGDFDMEEVHAALKDVFGNRVNLDNFFKENKSLTVQDLQWPFLSRQSQRPLMLEYGSVFDGKAGESPAEFWSIRRMEESERMVN